MRNCHPSASWHPVLQSTRNTIQKAYRELESDGYIYTVAGKGTFVAEHREVFDDETAGVIGGI